MTTSTATPDPKSFKSFAEFYPFYLGERRNRTCRRTPASFKRPLYSLMGDWAMYRDIRAGRIPL